jgi:hypothetical protein
MFSSLSLLNFNHFMLSKCSDVTQEYTVITPLFGFVMYVIYYTIFLC